MWRWRPSGERVGAMMASVDERRLDRADPARRGRSPTGGHGASASARARNTTRGSAGRTMSMAERPTAPSPPRAGGTVGAALAFAPDAVAAVALPFFNTLAH